MTEQYPQNGHPPVAPQPPDAGYQQTYQQAYQQPAADAYQQTYQQQPNQQGAYDQAAYQQPVYQATPQPYPQSYQETDSGSFGWAVLGFFFPIVGLILFLVWKQSKPKCAKVAGIGAVVGVGISVGFSILGVMMSLIFMPFYMF